MSLFDNLKSEAAHVLSGLEPQFQVIAAMVWRDAKQAFGSAEAAARQEVHVYFRHEVQAPARAAHILEG